MLAIACAGDTGEISTRFDPLRGIADILMGDPEQSTRSRIKKN